MRYFRLQQEIILPLGQETSEVNGTWFLPLFRLPLNAEPVNFDRQQQSELMAYALIDNASLTAVQRVTGKIAARNPDTINGDLAAMENLIQAILFYDDLVTIDNYKEQFRESRSREFAFINFLPPDRFGLPEIDSLSRKEAAAIQPEIKSGEFSDPDFKELIEMLKLSMVCTWDMRSSVYYLTLKMLGHPNTHEYEKYSGLSASIFNELSDVHETKGRWSDAVTLLDSSGKAFAAKDPDVQPGGFGGTTRALDMFIASLNWLAYKSIYYNIAAKHLKADAFIHPIRHAYSLHWMKKTGAFGHDFTARLLKNLANKVTETVSDTIGHGRPTTMSLDIPIFSAWLTQEAGDIADVVSSAMELKKANQFVVARQTIREIKVAYEEGGFAQGNKKATSLVADLDKISGDLKRAYGVPSKQGIQGSFLIKTLNTVTAIAGIPPLPEKEFAISTPQFMKSNKSNAFSTIFKDITNELTSFERLGGLRDKMTQRFEIDDASSVPPKTEDPKFRNVSSHWKRQMV
jgi:hypothetical protein